MYFWDGSSRTMHCSFGTVRFFPTRWYSKNEVHFCEEFHAAEILSVEHESNQHAWIRSGTYFPNHPLRHAIEPNAIADDETQGNLRRCVHIHNITSSFPRLQKISRRTSSLECWRLSFALCMSKKAHDGIRGFRWCWIAHSSLQSHTLSFSCCTKADHFMTMRVTCTAFAWSIILTFLGTLNLSLIECMRLDMLPARPRFQSIRTESSTL